MTKRETALVRLTQAGVVVADGASLMVEILAENASAEATDVYTALGMEWSILVGQIRRECLAIGPDHSCPAIKAMNTSGTVLPLTVVVEVEL